MQLKKINFIGFYILFTLSFYDSKGETIFKTLYINSGIFQGVKDSVFPALAFNESEIFFQNSSKISLSPGDELTLTIINRDVVAHSFFIKDIASSFGSIAPLESKTENIKFNKEGVFIYYDNTMYPSKRYLGLAGMITVLSPNQKKYKNFFWNIREYSIGFNRSLDKNLAVNWKKYDPEFFTVNGNSFPKIMDDTSAFLTGRVGDTLNIYIANTGQSAHSLHFHGFHLKILYSSFDQSQQGWIKDSFPIKSMETMILQMVPDKKGEYTVHDHNLMATSGALIHPFGMVMMMLIE